MILVVALSLLAAPSPEAPATNIKVVIVPAANDSTAFVDNIYDVLARDGFRILHARHRGGIDQATLVGSVGDRERAKKALQDARNRFRELDIDNARTLANNAVQELASLARAEDQSELFVDALVFQASVASAQGDKGAADDALLLAARLEPNRTLLDAGLYPPSVVEAFARAHALMIAERSDQTRLPTILVDVEVAGDVRPIECLLDGANINPNKPAAAGLGLHLLTCRSQDARKNGAAETTLVRIDQATHKIAMYLDAASGSDQRTRWVKRIRAGDGRAIDELRTHVGASAVVVLQPPRMLHYGDRTIPVEPTADTPERVALAISAAIQTPPDDVNWWAIGAAGAGGAVLVSAMAVAAGVYFGVPLSEPVKPPARPVVIGCCTN
jgi:hypothetical protein